MIKRTHSVPGRATRHLTWPERPVAVAALCLLGVAPLLLADNRAHAEPAEQAEGEETPATEQAPRIPRSLGQGWNFELGTYFWASSLNGNATVAGQSLQIEASFIDVVQETDSLLALDLLFVARKGRWGFLLDPWFFRAGGGATGPMGNDFDLTARMLIFETTGFYTFFQRAAGRSGKTTISIDAILGLRISVDGPERQRGRGALRGKGLASLGRPPCRNDFPIRSCARPCPDCRSRRLRRMGRRFEHRMGRDRERRIPLASPPSRHRARPGLPSPRSELFE